jgi:dTDP-4-amino-4,6-dideoxygalactose transaminase
MLREIGSNFWLNPNETLAGTPLGTPARFNCKGEDNVWLSTGRSAIRFVIQTIEKRCPAVKKVAVLPSFTCDTVFEPFLKAGYEVFYYPVEMNLTTTSEAIRQVVNEHDASIVLFHRYFGFDTLDSHVDILCDEMRKMGIFTIEDCTQCLYSDFKRGNADFTIGSIRKWTGTPDGGFAICRDGVFEFKPQKTDLQLETAKVKASYAKYRYLFENTGNKSEMLAMYRYAEDILDGQTDIYAISNTSSIVQANLNVDNLKRKRRENFNVLSTCLKAHIRPLFPLINGPEVPLYFPIFTKDRASLQNHLVQNAIYAPIVWPKSELQPEVDKEAENAYQHLLCIPIDQRYDAEDMNRIADVINNFYKE